ncbi:MAG: capsule assembly Wzi family protein [Flavisolibacter sp.]
MQFKETTVRLLLLLFPSVAFSQTTYLPQDARENILIERLEIKGQKDSILNFSKIKPYSRKQFIPAIEKYFRHLSPSDSSSAPIDSVAMLVRSKMSGIDEYNARITLMNSSEWASQQFTSKKPFWKSFYKSPANLYEVNVKDFFLAVNPVFQYYIAKEKNNDEHIFLNTRGVSLRGRIADKIGFAAYLTDNQERDPIYVQEWSTAHRAVPGAGFYKAFKTTGYDYFDARGYFTFNVTRYIDVQFGYDKNFIGNGYRSLFLSDFSSPFLFLKLNTRVWKFNLQNIFAELNSAQRLNPDQLFPKKYAAIHHLDLAITKWLNIGLFEGVIFGRPNHFEFGYLNPVIFYRSIEQQNGSFDNAVVGIDAKANVAKRFQFYGQLLLDEFNLTELKKGSGYWGNKIAVQWGAKYIDAFNIKNLDLQIEDNWVRPFTYSHRDSVANYTHYNQPLAHPLGANFNEVVAILRYQPAPKWLVQAKAFYFMQGKDTGNISFGSNIFLPNVLPYRTQDFGYDVGDAVKGKTALASMLLSFELKPNFFIELNTVYRNESETTISPAKNTFIIYGGVRWNMHRRDFEF